MIEQKGQEWRVKMWIATIDIMMASGSIGHNSVWNTLKTCGIEQEYISLLKRLYKDQKTTVLTDKESDIFEIKRRTKQGDPLSSLLFNTALQVALKSDFPHWQKKKRNVHMFGRLRVRLPHKKYDLLTTCSCLRHHANSYKNDV